MSLRFFDGFDIMWFTPGIDNSLVPIIPKWGGTVRPFTMSPSASNLSSLWGQGRLSNSKAIRSPMNVHTNLGSGNIVVGLGFKWETQATIKSGLIWSVWNGIPGSGTHLFGLQVNESGYLQIVQGGTWNKDASSWGLSGATVRAQSSSPINASEWYYIESEISIDASGSCVVAVYLNETLLMQASFNVGSVSIANLELWVSSNYTYKDSSNNFVPAHYYDDFYFVTNDGQAPSSRLGNVYVWTMTPTGATLTEWNATSDGHISSVNEPYISLPQNDPQYVYTNQFNKAELWTFNVPQTEIASIIGVQSTAWCNLKNFSPSNLTLVRRYGTTMVESIPISSFSNNLGYITRVWTTSVDGSQWTPDKVAATEFGVKTVQ